MSSISGDDTCECGLCVCSVCCVCDYDGAIVGCGCSLHAGLLNNERCNVYQHRHTLLLCSANVHGCSLTIRRNGFYLYTQHCHTVRTTEQKATVFGQ